MTRNSQTVRVRHLIWAAMDSQLHLRDRLPTSAIGDGFMNIPDGVEDEGLPFN